ncbi:hypothetical protein BJ875DRAFT_55722 [Amylocarpus encephaloides]|uniref:Uncharacterized protein n=1 Tax=Amylocarpus encephaloides TaxID=45428 RepID=A0A9P7YR62_9HELO|nr:hypothetical protein BJ875DRAFT_55722 [Amylocarpus encephaloides]
MDKEHRHGQRRNESKKTQHHRHKEHRAQRVPHRKHRDDLERDEKKSHAATRDNAARPLLERLRGSALSGDKDYVRRWLAGTEGVVSKQTCVNARDQAPVIITSREAKLSRVHGQIAQLEHHAENTGNTTRKATKRRHKSTSDSSMLEAPAGSPKETFEKRARHKTREDRYEPKAKRQKADKIDHREREKKSGCRKKDVRKAKKDSEELMQNFTSKNIGQERLTIRAPFGLGLFQNGRSSNGAKSNGVPDLAFSEMLSLQNEERHRPTFEMEQTLDKTRDRERRTERGSLTKAQEDVSSFFNQFRKPPQMLDMNQVPEAMSYSTRKSTALPAHNPTPSLYSHQRETSSHAASLPGHWLGKYDQVESARIPRRATSQISWSETQFSPHPQPKQENSGEAVHCCTSPIPKSILDSLRRTGVYIDTGIQTHQSIRGSFESPDGRLSGHSKLDWEPTHIQKHSNDEENLSRHDAVASTESSRQIGNSHPQRRSPSMTKVRPEREGKSRDSRGKDQQIYPSEATLKAPGECRCRPGEIIIEHFNRDLGWHQKSTRSQTTQISESASDPVIPESPPKDRKRLAKEARIKLPATAAPILHAQECASRFADKRDSLGVKYMIRPLIAPLRASTESAVEVTSKPTNPSHTDAERQPASSRYSQYRTQPRMQQQLHESLFFKNDDGQDHPISLESLHRNTMEFTPPMTDFRSSSSLYHQQQQGLNPEVNGLTILGLPMRGGLSDRINIATRMSPVPVSGPLFVRQVYQDVEVDNTYGEAQNSNVEGPRMDMISPESVEGSNFGEYLQDWNHPLEDVIATQHGQHLEPSNVQAHEYMLDMDEIGAIEPRNKYWYHENQMMGFSQNHEDFGEHDNLDPPGIHQCEGHYHANDVVSDLRGDMFYQEIGHNDVSSQPTGEEFQGWRFDRQFRGMYVPRKNC